MSQTVSVLVLGRREVVKVTPSTLLHAVLDEVCSRRNLDPSAHALKPERGGAPIDLSASFRLSGLANNCKLELVAAQAGAVQGNCRVGVQLDDGQRLVREFALAAPVGEVLAWAERECGRALLRQLTYAAHTVDGDEALGTTTLRRLGAVPGGSMLFRAAFAPAGGTPAPAAVAPPVVPHVEPPAAAAANEEPPQLAAPMDVDVEPAQAAPLPAPINVPPPDLALAPPPPPPSLAAAASAAVAGPAAASAALAAAESDGEALELLFEQQRALAGPLRRLRAATGGGGGGQTDFVRACEALRAYISNVVARPAEAKVRTVRVGGGGFQQRLGRFDGGVAALVACGFQLALPQGADPTAGVASALELSLHLPLPESDAARGAQHERLVAARQALDALLEAGAPDQGGAPESPPSQQVQPPQQPPPTLPPPQQPPPQPQPQPQRPPPPQPQQPPAQLARGSDPLAHGESARSVGQTLTEAKVAALRSRKESVRADVSVAREPTVFRTTGQSLQAAIRAANALPDAFFEVGAVDLGALRGGAASGGSGAAGPSSAGAGGSDAQTGGGGGGGGGGARVAVVQTKAMRELARLERLPEFRRATVRVRVSADHLLQAHFHPLEPVSRLADLLENEWLEPPTRAAEAAAAVGGAARVRLHTTPPLQLLDCSRSFAEQGLAPAALVHVSWEAPDAAATRVTPALRAHMLGTRENSSERASARESERARACHRTVASRTQPGVALQRSSAHPPLSPNLIVAVRARARAQPCSLTCRHLQSSRQCPHTASRYPPQRTRARRPRPQQPSGARTARPSRVARTRAAARRHRMPDALQSPNGSSASWPLVPLGGARWSRQPAARLRLGVGPYQRPVTT
jgi:hypothetical protein